MSDFGLFESAVVEDSAPEHQARLASSKLGAAIYDVHQAYGRFLLGATGLDEFEDRWHYSKNDIRRTVEPHLLPVTGVMRRVHDALKREYKLRVADDEAGTNIGVAQAAHDNVAQNGAGVLPMTTPGDSGSIPPPNINPMTKGGRRHADKTEPDMHIQQTDFRSDDNLIPEDNFEGYKDSVDQGGPAKVQRDFGSRSGEDDWEDTSRHGSIAVDIYKDWARSNGLRVASRNTLLLYSPNCSDSEYRTIAASLRLADKDDDLDEHLEEDVDEDEERLDEDEEEKADEEDDDEGDDEGDEDEESDGDDDDSGPPWLTGAVRRLAAPGDNWTVTDNNGRQVYHPPANQVSNGQFGQGYERSGDTYRPVEFRGGEGAQGEGGNQYQYTNNPSYTRSQDDKGQAYLREDENNLGDKGGDSGFRINPGGGVSGVQYKGDAPLQSPTGQYELQGGGNPRGLQDLLTNMPDAANPTNNAGQVAKGAPTTDFGGQGVNNGPHGRPSGPGNPRPGEAGNLTPTPDHPHGVPVYGQPFGPPSPPTPDPARTQATPNPNPGSGNGGGNGSGNGGGSGSGNGGGGSGSGNGGGNGGGGAAPTGQQDLQPGQYRVNEGDTLSGISQTLKGQGIGTGNYKDLIPLNKGDIGTAGTNIEKNENLIHPGDILNTGAPKPADPNPAAGAETGAGLTRGEAINEARGGPVPQTDPKNIAPGATSANPAATTPPVDVNTPPKTPAPASRNTGRQTLSYFRSYYGTRRLAAEEDEQGPPPDDGGGEAPPDQGAPPPDAGGGMDPSMGGGAPPPAAAPAPLENQPAEDHLLDTASQAVDQMIQQETAEYQQMIDPLQQALQAIQYAQQVEQQENPLDVTPPQGTVDVGPADAATAPGAPPSPQMQQMAFRVAKKLGMTRTGYRMLITAMGRKHYQTIVDAIAGLPPQHRGQVASTLGQLLSDSNPRMNMDKFLAAAGVDPRMASRRRQAAPGEIPTGGPLEGPMDMGWRPGEPWTPESEDDLDMKMVDTLHRQHHDDPFRKYGPELDPAAGHAGFGEFASGGPDQWDYDAINRMTDQRQEYERNRTSRRRAGVSWNETKNAPLAEHEQYDLDPDNWGGDDNLGNFEEDDPDSGYDYRSRHPMPDPHESDFDYEDPDPYGGDPMDEIAQSRMYQQHMQDPTNMFHGSRLGFNGRRQGAATVGPTQQLNSFKFPGSVQPRQDQDALSITQDNFGDPEALQTPAKSAARRRAKSAPSVYNQVVQNRSQKGLVTDPGATVDEFQQVAPTKGVSENAINHLVKQKLPSVAPIGGGGGGGKKSRKKGNFFTRRVPGWDWNDHLAAYTADSATPFQCRCGSQFDVPSYYNCRCGATYNAYPIGNNGEDGRTASIDKYLCREINVRPGMLMEASTHVACDGDCGGTCPEHVDWVSDDEREDADPPHAPGKNARLMGGDRFRELDLRDDAQERAFLAAIGEDDHSVVYRDGDRYCSHCDAKLWDPNVHHCPAKQAARRQAGDYILDLKKNPITPGDEDEYWRGKIDAEHDEANPHDHPGDEWLDSQGEHYNRGYGRPVNWSPETDPFDPRQGWQSDWTAARRRKAARAMFGKDDDDGPTVGGISDNSTLTPHLKQKVKNEKGTDGEEASEHVEGRDKKATRAMFGDWTKYDEEEDPGHGPGRAAPPNTHVDRPPEDWARRGRPKGPASLWREPIFPTSRG